MTSEHLLRARMFEFMSAHNTVNIAYIYNDEPASCAVWFAVGDDMTLYFVSSMKSHHGIALKPGAPIAFTIHKDEQDWRAIKGIQGKGKCSPVPDEQRDNAWQTYSKRFPFVIKPFADIAQALSVVSLWQVRPSWLRMIDNGKGFGYKEELRLA